MMFVPILVMASILLVLTVLLAVADRLLVNYGQCTVKVSQGTEQQSFVVEGGGSLLTSLVDNGIPVSNSCGGKGSCGYCKVRVVQGGGPILPTEELFMSRQEKSEDMRLACQVKIKNDLEVVIPDYLTIVRQMVVNNKFDAKKRWLVTINGGA